MKSKSIIVALLITITQTAFADSYWGASDKIGGDGGSEIHCTLTREGSSVAAFSL